MRFVILLLAVSVLMLGAASSARAEDSAVALGDRSFDAPSRAGPQAATNWVQCGSPYYARSYAPSLMEAPRKKWHATLAAYVWATSITGTSWADGTETDIDVAFEDLADKLDSAFMGYAEFSYCRWSIAIDASFVSLEESNTGPRGRAELTSNLDQTIVDLRLGYQFLSRKVGSARWGCCCYPRELTLDAVIGARYWSLEQEVALIIPTGQQLTVEDETHWWDPYLGARMRWQFAKRWGLSLYGDVGGFEIGDASNLTWQFQALLRFHITRGFFVGLGYRALDVDRVEGTGTTRSGIDATYHGPMIGLGYRF